MTRCSLTAGSLIVYNTTPKQQNGLSFLIKRMIAAADAGAVVGVGAGLLMMWMFASEKEMCAMLWCSVCFAAGRSASH